MSGQLHALAALPRGEEGKILDPTGTRTPNTLLLDTLDGMYSDRYKLLVSVRNG
jgi:hypothetical protein